MQFKKITKNLKYEPKQQEIYIKNKFKSKNSIDIQSVTSELKSSPPSTSELNHQTGNRQFSQLKQLVDNFEESGEVIRLAYLTNSQEVHIDEEALYFLQKYSTFEVAFIAFVGEKEAGKSFALDALLNLCCAEGNQFTTITEQGRDKGIYLWTTPFSMNFKRKIFLIQCSGITFQQSEVIREDQILLDLVNIIASTLVVFNPSNQPEKKKKRKNPIFQKEQTISLNELNFIEEMKKSAERILKDTQPCFKQDTFWPQTIYSVYYSKPPTQVATFYEQNFCNCNLSQLPQPFLLEGLDKQQKIQALNNKLSGISHDFLSGLNELFMDVIDRTTSKQYLSLKYTGNICCKLLINSIKYLNKKPKIKINKIFHSILKELYLSSYTYHTELYDDYLKEYFSSEQPLSFDDLLEAFKSSSTYVIDSFNEMIVEEELHQEYQNKLLTYIDKKEELIIEINSKKTKNTLKEKIRQIQNVKINDVESIKAFLVNLNTVQHKLDHNKTPIIAQKILKYTKNIEKRILEQREKIQKQTIARLQTKKANLQTQLRQLRQINEQNSRQNRQNEKKSKGLTKSINNSDVSIKGLKKEIEAQKRYQKEYIVNKQSRRQYAENLLDTVRQLEQKIRENKRTMDQIRKQYEYHPDILQLQKKIEERTRQTKQLEKIQSKMEMLSRNSFISKNSALKSNTSIVRSAMQKPKEPKEIKVQSKPIKKLTKK